MAALAAADPLKGRRMPGDPIISITRIFADAAGETHFEALEIPLADAGIIGYLSETISARGVIFRENPADYFYDWHPAPDRQFIVMLDGEIEIEVSDGEVRRFRCGDVLLVEDTHGRGHKTRNIGGTPRRSLFILLDEKGNQDEPNCGHSD